MNDTESKPKQWLTLPNIVTMVRIVGSPGMIMLAVTQQTAWLAGFVVFLVFTEWFDGFLARRMHSHSEIGARLDTVADAIFYASLLVAVVILRPATIGHEAIWIAAAWASYLLNWIASWWKFHCLPSYHTWTAKGAWGVVGIGILCLLFDVSPWPFRFAMVYVVATNVEAIGITMLLQQSEVDVRSLWHLWRR